MIRTASTNDASARSDAAKSAEARKRTGAGIALMCLTMLIFASQDAISTHLVGAYNVWMVTALRYVFMVALALAIAARGRGVRATLRSARPMLQIVRGALLAAQICILVSSFVLLGLIETHAIFAATPLLITVLAGALLGERIGVARWIAVAVGFAGVLVILEPGFGVVSPYAPLALLGCVVFAAYTLLTRVVAKGDAAETSFLWTALVGFVLMVPVGAWLWEPMSARDAAWMALLCVCSGVGHLALIRVYVLAEASAVQPFTYLQLVFASVLAVAFLGEALEWNVVIGALLVVAAGTFAILRAR